MTRTKGTGSSERPVAPDPLGRMSDRVLFLALLALSVLVRLPYLSAFDLVDYDGTYYINLARSLLRGDAVSGPFPIGYPLAMLPLVPLMDDVRAAQIVSFAASMGTLVFFYKLAREYIQRSHAVLATCILALTPLFIRLSLMTLSEASYIFWLILGLYLFKKEKHIGAGLALGAAAITRPEAIMIAGLLVLLCWRGWRRGAVMLAAFAVIYSINVALFSISAKQLIVLQKSEFFGTSAESWKAREAFIEFEGKEEIIGELGEKADAGVMLTDYMKRLPREFMLLARHAMPVVMLLGLYAMVRRRGFLLVALIPFLLFPLVTKRTETRYVLPYIPFFILFAFVGLELIRRRRTRRIMLSVLLVASVVGFAVNIDALTERISEGYESAKTGGLEFRNRVSSGDRMADRKPFFAFYAEALYEKVPAAPYEDTMNYLAEKDVRYLALHVATTHQLRPALRPLLYDRALITGELRYRQVYTRPSGELVYEKIQDRDPLQYKMVAPAGNARHFAPSWSPDGRLIAYREEQGDRGAILIVSPGGGEPKTIVTEPPTRDPLSWSPDSRHLAFANRSRGSMDVFTYDLLEETLTRITDHDADDMSPSWARSGEEIVFTSNRSGQEEVWSFDTAQRTFTQLTTTGETRYPAVSLDGSRIAWTGPRGMEVLDRSTGRISRAPLNRELGFAPSWSPDGRVMAVTGVFAGATNVYLVAADFTNALVLTKTLHGVGQPAWDNTGRRLAVVSNREGTLALYILSGVEPYVERLFQKTDVTIFPPIHD